MITAKGNTVQPGIAIGTIRIYHKTDLQILPDKTNDTSAEWKKYLQGKKEAAAQLKKMEKLATQKLGREEAMIFGAHQMILSDPQFEETVKKNIKEEHFNAAYAVYLAGEAMAGDLAAIEEDPYMKERAVDLRDVSMRVIRRIRHVKEEMDISPKPVILLADDLTPSETIGLNTDKILAFVTAGGSTNSHTAILARSFDIPMIVNTEMELPDEYNGKTAIVDASDGMIVIDPTEEMLEKMVLQKRSYEKQQEELKDFAGKKTVTKGGRTIRLSANVGSVAGVRRAVESGADGIGLFRSEFLYLNRPVAPTEEEQFAAYKTALTLMGDREVIIRTLDIGADKRVDYLQTKEEENPAMGLRAIRLGLERPDAFKVQLRALYRAGAFGKLGIMFPMITSTEEVGRIRQIMDTVREELLAEGYEIGNPKVGIMIETPAAAVISDQLAKVVDFFSIGTNDLTQFTLAMDRKNPELTGFRNEHHTAVLRLIEMTVQNAGKAGIPVSICGELAADPDLTEYFINLGIDELSVSTPGLLALRKRIRSLE